MDSGKIVKSAEISYEELTLLKNAVMALALTGFKQKSWKNGGVSGFIGVRYIY